MARLDSHVAQLTSIFQMKGGVAGQKLPKHLEILQEETSDVNLKRTAILKGLCIYLGEDEGQLVQEYIDIEGNDILRDLQKHTMGIYVINKEGGEMRHCDDIGIFVEGVIILRVDVIKKHQSNPGKRYIWHTEKMFVPFIDVTVSLVLALHRFAIFIFR